MKKAVNILILISFSVLSLNVYAQDKRAQAKQHYMNAEKYYVNGEFDKAVVEYKKAFELKPIPGLLFNIAQCHRQLKNYDKALFFYKLYLSKVPDTQFRTEIEKHIADLTKKLSEIKQKMGKVTIMTTPKGATVLLDTFEGKPIGVTPVVVDITSGTHLLVIKKKGFEDVAHRLEIKAGQMNFVTLTLKAVAGASAATTAVKNDTKVEKSDTKVTKPDTKVDTKIENKPEDKSNNAKIEDNPAPAEPTPLYKKWWFVTGTSVTAVLLGASIYTGTQALKYESDYNDNPDQDTKDKGEGMARTTDILIGAAILTGGATLLAVILSHDDSEDNPEVEKTIASDNKQSFSILPSVGYNNFGLVFNWKF